MLNDKVYNVLKWVTMLALPATATLYYALSTIWGLPYGEEVVATIAALTTFFGVLLGVSTVKYNKTIEEG